MKFIKLDNNANSSGSSCNCGIEFSIRDMMQIGIKPAINNIATIISSALLDPDFFGKYIVGHVFVMGTLFDGILPSTPINAALRQIILESIQDSNQFKVIEPKCFVLLKSVQELTKPTVGKKPFLNGNFGKGGVLRQLSKETYSFRLFAFDRRDVEKNEELTIFYQQQQQQKNGRSNKWKSVHSMYGNCALVVVHLGQIIPPPAVGQEEEEGIKKTFFVEYKEHYRDRVGFCIGKDGYIVI